MKKYSLIFNAIIALVTISFCVTNLGCNKNNKERQDGSNQAYLKGQANQISETIKKEAQERSAANKEESLNDGATAEEAQQVTNNIEATTTQSEASEVNDGDSPSSKYQEALNAFLKDGYYFKDGKKPEKIKSLNGRVEILNFPKEVGIFAKFETTFDFEGVESPGRRIELVFVNTSNKKFENVFDTIVSTLDKREIVSEDDPSAFIGFHQDITLLGDMTIINLISHYRSDRLDVYKNSDKIFIGYDQRRSKKEILYIFKREAIK